MSSEVHTDRQPWALPFSLSAATPTPASHIYPKSHTFRHFCIGQVLLEGSPVSPPDRFAAVIARHRVSVLKAGSTFLRMLMMRSDAEALLTQHNLASLRLGTFCAEPVNAAVHHFAATRLTPNYINSYWASEHGAIILATGGDESNDALGNFYEGFMVTGATAAATDAAVQANIVAVGYTTLE